MKNKILEWSGVITAILYSLLVAFNIERNIFLQFFYASAGIIGMIRWF